MPEAAVAHHRDHALAEIWRHRARRRQPHAVAEHGIADVEGRLGGERAAPDVVSDVRVADRGLVGAQDLHGAEHRPLRAPRAERRRALGDRTRQDLADTLLMAGQPSIALLDERGAERSWLGRGQEAREAADDELGHVLAVGRQHVLAVDLDVEPGVVGQRFQLLLDVIRHPLFDHEHVTLAAQEPDQLLGHDRMQDVEHEQGHRGPAVDGRQAEHVESAQGRVPETTLHDDAEVLFLAAVMLVQPALGDVAARGRQSLLELLRLHRVGERRQVDALDAEARVSERRQHADGRAHVVAARQLPAHVTGADADAEEDRLVARFGETEPLFDEPRERRQAVLRIDERNARLQRRGVRPFLEDAGALTIILADDDQRATDDACGRDVRKRIGGDVGADHRLPGDGAPHRIVDGRSEERGGRRLTARLLEVDPHRPEQRLVGVGQDVEQMRDGSTRITTDVAHARLEEGLGDGEDALATQNFACPVAELLDVLGEGPLAHPSLILA